MHTRVHRIALVATWMVVSLLAVVGFANFSAAPAPEAIPVTPTYAPDLGVDAGAVSAMAFAFPGGRGLAAQAVVVEEPVVEASTSAEKPARSSTTFVRSTVLNESAIRELAGDYFAPEDVARAIRSAWCASGFDPGYHNAETGAAGLFQLTPQQWAEHAPGAGRADGDIFDPRTNMAVAAWIVYESTGSWTNLTCTG